MHLVMHLIIYFIYLVKIFLDDDQEADGMPVGCIYC